MDDGHENLPAEFDRLVRQSSAYAPRQVAAYFCDREHLISVPFAEEADPPETWDCRCGQQATLLVAGNSSAAG